MAKISMHEPKKTLIFNPARVLIGVVRSVRAAAELTQTTAQGISNAANGKAITSTGYYWRHECPDKVEIEISDIGVLTLEEYDEMCDLKRSYVKSHKIKNKRVIGLGNKK